MIEGRYRCTTTCHVVPRCIFTMQNKTDTKMPSKTMVECPKCMGKKIKLIKMNNHDTTC